MQADVENLLVAWGKWSRGGYGNLGAKNIWMGGDAAAAEFIISDDDALLVDKAVVALTSHDLVLGGLVKLHYIGGHSQLRLQERLRLSRHEFDKKLRDARGFIFGFVVCRKEAA